MPTLVGVSEGLVCRQSRVDLVEGGLSRFCLFFSAAYEMKNTLWISHLNPGTRRVFHFDFCVSMSASDIGCRWLPGERWGIVRPTMNGGDQDGRFVQVERRFRGILA